MVVEGVVVAAAGGGETHIMTAAMTATTDMMSMTIGIVGDALHHLTTVDTGLVQGLAPIAHDDTKLLLSKFCYPPIFVGVWFIKVFFKGETSELACLNQQFS